MNLTKIILSFLYPPFVHEYFIIWEENRRKQKGGSGA